MAAMLDNLKQLSVDAENVTNRSSMSLAVHGACGGIGFRDNIRVWD